MPSPGAINLDADAVQLAAVTLPAPVAIHVAAGDEDFEQGLHDVGIHGGLRVALNAEGLADGGCVLGTGLDELHQGAEVLFDAGGHGGDGGGQRERGGRGGRGAGTTDAHEVFPRRPLLGKGLAGILALEAVVEVVGVLGLVADLLGGEAKGGGVAADVVFEQGQLGTKGVVVGFDVIGFGHGLAFGFDGCDGRGRGIGHEARIAGLEVVGGVSPAEVWVILGGGCR